MNETRNETHSKKERAELEDQVKAILREMTVSQKQQLLRYIKNGCKQAGT